MNAQPMPSPEQAAAIEADWESGQPVGSQADILPQRHNALQRAWSLLCALWLRYEIHSAEQFTRTYGRGLQQNGLDPQVVLNDTRAHTQALRVRLAMHEAVIYPTKAHHE